MLTLTLDYSKRHCWGPDNLGRFAIDGKLDQYCVDWKNHVKNAGPTEFLRWIREFGVLAPRIVTGFPDGSLVLGPDIMSDGTEMYCENYDDKVKAFLNVDAGIAMVEIHDDDLEEEAYSALYLVSDQYLRMVAK